MINKFLSTLKQFRRASEDAKLGRELIGQDKHGNLYYQYYNRDGTPSKRMSERLDKQAPFVDPMWEEWIRHLRDKPYSDKELQEIQEKNNQYQDRVKDYENKDQQMMKDYKKQASSQWNPNKK